MPHRENIFNGEERRKYPRGSREDRIESNDYNERQDRSDQQEYEERQGYRDSEISRYKQYDKYSDTLQRLENCARVSKQLSDEDLKQLHLIIEAYKGWQVLGKAAKWFVMFLAGFSAVIVALTQFKEGLKLWLL